MRVEVLEHSLKRGFQQLAPVDRPNVIRLNLFNGVDKDAVQFHRFILGLRPLAALPARQGDSGDQHARAHIFRRGISAIPPGERTASPFPSQILGEQPNKQRRLPLSLM